MIQTKRKYKPLNIEKIMQSVYAQLSADHPELPLPDKEVKITVRNNFSCVELTHTSFENQTEYPIIVTRIHAYGFSKRHPKDAFDPNFGKKIALSRAVSDYVRLGKIWVANQEEEDRIFLGEAVDQTKAPE